MGYDTVTGLSALESEGRDVFVLTYDSKRTPRPHRTEVTGEREVGLRDDKLVVYSAEIGPEDRIAIEECFIVE